MKKELFIGEVEVVGVGGVRGGGEGGATEDLCVVGGGGNIGYYALVVIL